MTTQIGLISDVHASPIPLQQALELFARENVDKIICAGDIAGYFDSLESTIELLIQSNCKTIMGNHDQTYLDSRAAGGNHKSRDFLQALPLTLELRIEEKRILVVHAQPPSGQHGGIKLLRQNGDIDPQFKHHWSTRLEGLDQDILIVGHTHQVFAERLGEVLVINPGSSQFNHSCMILSLPDLKVRTFSLENRDIVKCWNFSMLRPRTTNLI